MKFFSRTQSKALPDPLERDHTRGLPLEQVEKSRWERIWPALACGAGLFSDGYLNSFVLSKIGALCLSSFINVLLESSDRSALYSA